MSLTARFRSLSPQFLLVLSCLFIGMMALVAFELTAYRDGMTEERKMKSRALVESVVSLIQFYNEKATKEGYPLAEAQNLSLQAIREINNNEKEYFWITDTKGKMLMHATHPDFVGKNLGELLPPFGSALFIDIIKTVNTSDSGFVTYRWLKPGAAEDDTYQKISYVQNYKEWNWIVGSGIYLDDVNEAFINGIYVAGAMSIAVLLFTIALALTASETLRKV